MKSARSPVAFGHYVITRRIARGGMAEIYRARARSDARWVALKMMRSSLGHEELRSRLFEREARIAEKLTHDNVVPLFEHGTEMGRPFLAMEYLRGRDLSHLLRDEKTGREQLPLDLGLYIGFRAAAGLGHAHSLVDPDTGASFGIVHRDVSPGNVMIGYDGAVKVLDFGVARINETQGVHTQTGTLRGKFAYMSPEQTLGEDIDARSDVFSFGTVLYELLTGVNCFRAANPIATLERVQSLRPVPPSRANREIPREVDRILARCLAKDKKRRFRDAGTLSEALGEYLSKIGMIERGPAMLAAHMSQVFSWEKHEEESELAREEDEVALFDVVELSALPDDTGLDARHVAVSEEEEASQSEVKSFALAHRQARTAEDEVFEGDSARISGGPSGILAAAFIEEDPTKAFDAPVPASLDTARIILGSPVPGVAPPGPEPTEPAVGLLGDTVGQALATKAGTVTPALGSDGPYTSRTVMHGAPVARVRPWMYVASVLGLILLVAWIVTRDSLEEQQTVAPPKVMEPVTITLPPPKAPPPKEVRPPPPPMHLDPVPVAVRPPSHPVPTPPAEEPRPTRPSLPPPARAAPPPRRRPPPPPPAATPIGYLNVGAKPWAEIKIDGKPWPYQTPQAGIELPAGKHTVSLSNGETGVSKSTVVYIKPGAYRTVTMDLRK